MILNDDKTSNNQVKSALFHFLTEFKQIGKCLGSRSINIKISSCRFDRWPPFWPFRLVGHKLGGEALPFIALLRV